jgi:hypothetical protein
MPEKTIKRRLTEAGARDLADDDGHANELSAELNVIDRRRRAG